MMARNNSVHKISSLFIFTILFLSTNVLVQGMLLYPPRYQPELDQLSLEKYITDDYLFNMHINCLLYDGPCDPVGRWMRPRMASYFLSSCILCTPNQEKEADKFMTWLYENHPQLFRIGIGKYLDANGIKLPQKSKFREQVQKMNVPKVAISSIESEPQPEEKAGENTAANKPNDGEEAREKLEQDENLSNPTTIQSQNNNAAGEGGPSERILNSNARKNKFSSAISFSKGPSPGSGSDDSNFRPPSPLSGVNANNKFARLSTPDATIEDDEAEMDFKYYH